MVGSFSRTHCRDFLFSDFSVKYDFAPFGERLKSLSPRNRYVMCTLRDKQKEYFFFIALKYIKKESYFFGKIL